MINIEIEISSANAKEHLYELRNYLAESMENLQISVKEQPAIEGQMSAFSAEGILNGVIHAGVGIGIEHCIHILWPLISDWLKRKKSDGKKNIEVLATLGDNSDRVSFSEDSEGVTKRYENVSYSIDTARTRAILIGCAEFQNDFVSIPPVKGNLEDLYQVLTDKRNIGLQPENVIIAFNKTNTEIEELLLRTCKLPDTETLLIYFSGHGYRSDVDKLHLIASNSRKIENHILSGIDYDFIKKVILKTSPAKQKIVILDACHSGIATQGGQDAVIDVDVVGTYVLASSESDEVSYFDKTKRNTFFTGSLLDTLRNGIDNTREMLALNDLYENSKNHLDQKQQPRYKDKLNISPADFFIARNPSFSIDKNIRHATSLYKAGNLSEALREYRKILKRWPDNAEVKALAEQCNNDLLFSRFVKEGDELFYQSRHYKKALENYEQAYDIKPDVAIAEKIRSCRELLQTGEEVPMSLETFPVTPVHTPVRGNDLNVHDDKSKDDKKKKDTAKKVLALIITAIVIGIGSLLLFLFHGKKEKYTISELSKLLAADPATALMNLRKSGKKDSANYIIGNYQRENKDFDSAAYYYKKAIDKSNLPAAYSSLGEMYYKDELKDSLDNRIACSIFKKADSLGRADTLAYYYLGRSEEINGFNEAGWVGPIPDKFFERAEKWYIKGVNKGSLRCKYLLASLYLHEKQNPEKAFPYLKESAEKNITEAQIYLSDMYENGNGVARNEAEAYHWLRSFTTLAEPGQLLEFGKKYAEEETYTIKPQYVFKKNCQKAMLIFNAAESKIASLIDYKRPELYLAMGTIYEDGCGIATLTDKKQAISYYTKAANLGDGAADYRLKQLKVNR